MKISFNPETVGGDLVEYLAAQEANVEGITPGAEKEIIWYNPDDISRTEYVIVYVHGYSATKHEIRPVPDMLAKKLKANIFYTRLNGHGMSGEALAGASLSAWADDIAEAIEIGHRMGDKTIIVATSTGATLATWAMAQPQFKDKVHAMVFVSANYEVQGLPTWMGTMPFAQYILPMVGGSERSWKPANEEQAKWWTTKYPTKAVLPMMSLLKLTEGIDKSTITTPTQFIYTLEDTVIVPERIVEVHEQWGGASQALAIETKSRAKHVIAGDILDPANNEPVTNAILEWMKEAKL